MRPLWALFILFVNIPWLFLATTANAQDKHSSNYNARLLRACEMGDVVEVTRLLAEGAAPDAADTNNKTALMFAAEYEDTTTAREGLSSQTMVKALLNRGAKVNTISHQQETAVMKAIAKNNDAAVKLLLDNGASVHGQVVDEQTILVSSGNLSTTPLPQLRLHVEKKFSQGEWLPAAEKSGIKGLAAWKRPTNAHYRNMLALLKSAAHQRKP